MDLSELVRENKKKEQNYLNYFKKKLKTVHILIKRKNKDGIKYMIYDIPLLEWGVPLFEIAALRNYLFIHLQNNGFYVQVIENGKSLCICWDENVLDLEKFYIGKAEIEKDYRQTIVSNALPEKINRNTMEFRQKKQQEIKEERQKRLKSRQHRFDNLEKHRY